MKTFIWSDTHFNHDRILDYTERSQFENVAEMNECLIEAHNSVVGPEDTSYHAGDFGFEARTNLHMPLEEIGARLNGRQILIRGNHDGERRDGSKKASECEFWDEVYDYKEIKFGKTRFVIFHFPIQAWHGAHKGALHLHGHTHVQDYKNSKRYYEPHRWDVGVDGAPEFGVPYNLEYLRDMLNAQEDYNPKNHHAE